MRVLVATVQVPFIRGGAEAMAEDLLTALRSSGVNAEPVVFPFRFSPAQSIRDSMNLWAAQDFEYFDCGAIDKVICLKFPTYALRHPKKTVWLTHQHRSSYDLYDTPYGDSSADQGARELKQEVSAFDSEALARSGTVFTISKTVSRRLQTYNGVRSTPLYQPPRNEELFYTGDSWDYVFFPSRLETLKRQDLLIDALRLVRSPVTAVIAGEGGQASRLVEKVRDLGLGHKVFLVGRVSPEELRALYAHCLAVVFCPFDEDYGFVTLEAMLSSKPVISCADSGGPSEFVVSGVTGFVVEPRPDALAEQIDQLYRNKADAGKMGRAGLDAYKALGLSWKHIVETLLGGGR